MAAPPSDLKEPPRPPIDTEIREAITNIDVSPRSERRADASVWRGFGLVSNILLPLAMLSAAGVAVFLFGKPEPPVKPPTDLTLAGRLAALPTVRTATIQTLVQTGGRLTLDVDGTVVPFQEAAVAAEVAGRVIYKDVVCEAGQYVKKGQLLMRIDATDYQLEVDRLTRLQEQEYQSIREIEEEITGAQRLAELAEKDVEIQRAEVRRQTELPEGFASRGEVDRARRDLLAATQALLTQENQLQVLRQRRARLQASERLAQTQLKLAETNLARTEIRAPIDGVIVSEQADLNTFVARGTSLVTIDDTTHAEVACSLRSDQLYWVLNQENATSQPLSLGYELPETPAIIQYELAGRPGVFYRWDAKLLSYNGIGLDSQTRTVPVRILVENPSVVLDRDDRPIIDGSAPALMRGMYVTVKLLVKPTADLIVVPAEAMRPGNRLFKFEADASVLEVVNEGSDESPSDASEDVGAEPSEEATTSEAEANAQPSAPVIDVGKWQAGRVVVRGGIQPIDALTIDRKEQLMVGEVSDADSSSVRLGDSRKFWVCESIDGSVAASDLVVTSPLGGVPDSGLPSRTAVEDQPEETPKDEA
ncbi:MAG: HlyD family efflux transporter periplasmic adaptor subunit [Planctomycetota bacterium]